MATYLDVDPSRLELSRAIETETNLARRNEAWQIILGTPDFWWLPKPEINDLLRDVLGAWQLILDNGKIAGLGNMKPLRHGEGAIKD